MSESEHDPPAGAVLFSKKLLGLRSECPACGEWENSTGWLLSREDQPFRWYVDLKCSGCRSRGSVWKREWLPLIEEVLQAGRKSMMTVKKPCATCGGDGICSVCGGTAIDVGAAVTGGDEIDCPMCDGMGACPVCGGAGEVIEDEAGSEAR